MKRTQIKKTAIQIYLETVKIGGEDYAQSAVHDYLLQKIHGDTPSGYLPRKDQDLAEEICYKAEEKR